MRLHIQLEEELVADLDSLAALRRRSVFVSAMIKRGLEPDEESVARRWLRGLRLAPLGKRGKRVGRLASGWLTGGWRREFAARGVTVHQADCLIAAAALGASAALATVNVAEHPMLELEVQNPPSGT